jgi:LysR family glycine cleavage system transcriptional activator
MIERGGSLSKYPLLEGDEVTWAQWARVDANAALRSRAPSIDDSGGLIAAAEEGLGYVLARWTLVNRALRKGTLRLAGNGVLPYGSAYYFVCPSPMLALPKVAHFREWIFAAAKEFPAPDLSIDS